MGREWWRTSLVPGRRCSAVRHAESWFYSFCASGTAFKQSLDSSNAVFTNVTEYATPMTVDHVRNPAESHGSCGGLSLGYRLIFPLPHHCSHPAIHPCTDSCHAPGSCQETEPCTATQIITCPCGRVSQPVQCGRKLLNPTGGESSKTLKCTNECAVAKRNARLAEALGISSEKADRNKATYRDDLIAFAQANPKFIPVVEKSFAGCVV